MSARLESQRALVIGGGSGIGRGSARLLAADGSEHGEARHERTRGQ